MADGLPPPTHPMTVLVSSRTTHPVPTVGKD
jgi:hypothetical protein